MRQKILMEHFDDLIREEEDAEKANPEETAKIIALQKSVRLFEQKAVMQDKIAGKTGNELFEMAQKEAEFIKTLIVTDMIFDVLNKMSYGQTRAIYVAHQSQLTQPCRKRVEDLIRDKRQND